MLTSLVPIFNGKGDPLDPNSYREIVLLEHTFELYEKMLDGRLHEMIDIDKYSMGLYKGKRLLILCLF